MKNTRKEESINYVQVGRFIECKHCHPEKGYENLPVGMECSCICHDKKPEFEEEKVETTQRPLQDFREIPEYKLSKSGWEESFDKQFINKDHIMLLNTNDIPYVKDFIRSLLKEQAIKSASNQVHADFREALAQHSAEMVGEMKAIEYPRKSPNENEQDYRKRKRGFQLGKSKFINLVASKAQEIIKGKI